jgi:hypothetical protein
MKGWDCRNKPPDISICHIRCGLRYSELRYGRRDDTCKRQLREFHPLQLRGANVRCGARVGRAAGTSWSNQRAIDAQDGSGPPHSATLARAEELTLAGDGGFTVTRCRDGSVRRHAEPSGYHFAVTLAGSDQQPTAQRRHPRR